MILILISLALYTVPQFIVFWKLYQKAGMPGWTAIVPVYSYIVMAEIAKKSVVVGVIGGLFEVFWYLRLAIDNPILGIGRLVTIVFALYILNAFIKQYNRGIGYWALVIFLPLIAVFMTDKSEYKGGAGKVSNAQPTSDQATPAQDPNNPGSTTGQPPTQG